MKPPPVHAPVLAADRIGSLDVLRGFALLGILVMNMQAFAMIEAAYMNPRAYGDFTGVNRLTWVLEHLFGDLKFMALFSMLFGAGVFLLCDRARQRTGRAAGLHYRRMTWLLLIGLVHAYGFWYGDILVSYALCGMLVFVFRNLSPRWLLGLGLVALVPPSLLFLAGQASMPWWPEESMAELQADWKPGPELIAAELEAYRGGWWDQMTFRAPASLTVQLALFPAWFMWRPGGLMLIGMALLKTGVLGGQRSPGFYLGLWLAGWGLGLPLVAAGILLNQAHDWAVERSMFLGYQFNYWGSVPMALGHAGLVLFVVRAGLLKRVQQALAAMGRMALTNYLLQTLICTTIFYGHGFGLFGRIERTTQLLIALGILTTQMMGSVAWLRCFRHGPMEWAWRSLTYLRLQPLRPADLPAAGGGGGFKP